MFSILYHLVNWVLVFKTYLVTLFWLALFVLQTLQKTIAEVIQYRKSVCFSNQCTTTINKWFPISIFLSFDKWYGKLWFYYSIYIYRILVRNNKTHFLLQLLVHLYFKFTVFECYSLYKVISKWNERVLN